MLVLKMYVQIMSLHVLLCNVCVCYEYILKMSKFSTSALIFSIFSFCLTLILKMLRTGFVSVQTERDTYGNHRICLTGHMIGTFPHFVAIGFYFLSETLI
jgi:hypothetical protein